MDRGSTRLQLPEDEICLMRIISNQAAVALENMDAYEEIIDLKTDLEAETHFYRENYEAGAVHTQMIGRSEPFKKMLGLIDQVAKSDTTVMITGETGVGKDLVAQAIHQNSERASGPFIAVNVVSLSPELIASELFGHEKGAFTGASQTRKGRFELASEGTLFLDDIDAFSLDIQAKMLRVLETREFERVGGTRTLKTRFRLIAASNRNLEDLVEQGLFRSDFYFRLNVFPIKIPPLRERAGDISGLARYFMKIFAKKFGKEFDRISKRDLQALISYRWPGNIRELRHVIERAVLVGRNGKLEIPPLNTAENTGKNKDEKILTLKEMETRHILKALSACGGKVSGADGAAALLAVRPTTLYSKMKRLNIQREDYRVNPPLNPLGKRHCRKSVSTAHPDELKHFFVYLINGLGGGFIHTGK
jgi:transcriptional regulator with GAF, ATPase, and Fis domain